MNELMRVFIRFIFWTILAGASPVLGQSTGNQLHVAIGLDRSGAVNVREDAVFQGPTDKSSYGKSFQVVRRDQSGNEWRLSYTFEGLTINDAPVPIVKHKTEEATLLEIERLDTQGRKFSYSLTYRYENGLERHGDSESLRILIDPGRRMQDVAIGMKLPSPLPPGSEISAYTDVTASTLVCNCVVQQSPLLWTLQTTREVQDPITITVSTPKGFFAPTLSERIRLQRQAHPIGLAWLVFTASCLLFTGAVVWLIIYWPGTTERSRQVRASAASWSVGLLSVAISFLTNQPYSSMPGTGVGLLVGFALGGALPKIVIPIVAVFINAYFYRMIAGIIVTVFRRRERLSG